MRASVGRSCVSSLVLFAACGGEPAPATTAASRPIAHPVPGTSDASATRATEAPSTAEATTVSDAERAKDAALAPKVAAFIDAFSNEKPSLLRDGRVVFVSNREHVPGIYVGDSKVPAAPARRLPTPNERVTAVRVLPDERSLLFLSDSGADGNFRIYKVGIDGGTFEDITPGEKLHRDPPEVAMKANGVFAYNAHPVDDRGERVFIQRIDGAPREVYRDTQPGAVWDVSPDGAHILYRRFISENESLLFEIDAASGRTTRIYPAAEGRAARIGVARYSSDGKRIFVGSEAKDRAPWLLAFEGGKEVARYVEAAVPRGRVNDLEISPAGDRAAIMVDAGDHTEVRLLDAKRLANAVTLPTGPSTTFLGTFRADGKRLGLAVSTPEAPADIVAVDVATRAITKLRDEPRPGLGDLPKLAVSIEKVPAFDGLSIPVNLHLREGAQGKRPTIVLIHGGPSASATLRWNPLARFWNAMGFAVVEPNIRGSSGFGMDYERADDREKRGDALKDVGSVHDWARAQPWCDGDAMVIMGQSYGGYMTLLALTRQPSMWRAGVTLSGMSDLRTMEALEDQTIRAYDETEFGVLGRDDALLTEWSPLHRVDAITAPVFVYQGENDPVSPRKEADQIVLALRARKVPVEYMLLANEGHGVVRRENRIATLARIYRFLSTQLRLTAP